MARVAIVTDSTADLPSDLAAELAVTVVPLNVHFGTDTFRDGIDISPDQFYKRLVGGSVHPTTSQPSSGTFEAEYRRLLESHDAILSLHLSAKLSGTYNSAIVARNDIGDDTAIHVIDTRLISMALGFLVIEAATLARRGEPVASIVNRVEGLMPRQHILFMVDTLDFLQRGGRIGRAQALLGSLLNVKPILTLDQGEVRPLERVRTRSRGLERLFDFVGQFRRVERLAVLYTTTPVDAAGLIDRLSTTVPREAIVESQLSPVIGVHVGPGTIGIFVQEGAG